MSDILVDLLSNRVSGDLSKSTDIELLKIFCELLSKVNFSNYQKRVKDYGLLHWGTEILERHNHMRVLFANSVGFLELINIRAKHFREPSAEEIRVIEENEFQKNKFLIENFIKFLKFITGQDGWVPKKIDAHFLIHQLTFAEIYIFSKALPDIANEIDLWDKTSDIEIANKKKEVFETLSNISVDYENDRNMGASFYANRHLSSHDPLDMGKVTRLTVDLNAPKELIKKQFSSWIDFIHEEKNISFKRFKASKTDLIKWRNMNMLAALDLFLIKEFLEKIYEKFRLTETDFLDILNAQYTGRAADEYDRYENIINKFIQREFAWNLLAKSPV